MEEDIGNVLPQNNDSFISGIVLIGWHHKCKNDEEDQNLLEQYSKIVHSKTLKFILPATNDLNQIIEAVKNGASMFGCDLPAKWARARKAFALTFTSTSQNRESLSSGEKYSCTSVKIGVPSKNLDINGCMDLSDPCYAWDDSPIVQNSQCFSAKYTRSYVHHLIQAKELLAEIILFGHNLHHMISLCKEFSNARVEGKIDEFCVFLQNQLDS